MSQVSPYKERFSLAWLTPSEAPADANPAQQPNPAPAPTANPVPLGAEAVFNSIGNQVLAILGGLPESTLLNLASASNMRLEALLPVIQYLATKGLVERVHEDPSGNDTYKVTQAGLNPPTTSPINS